MNGEHADVTYVDDLTGLQAEIIDSTIAAIVADEEVTQTEKDKAWFDSLPRRERRRLFRQYGVAKGARRKGGGPR